jgi:predicted permease
MIETIAKAGTLVSFIACGYILKQLGLFSRESFNTISTIVFDITLPAAIIIHLNGVHFEGRLLYISVLAIVCNLIFIGLGYILGRDKIEKSFYMLNLNGFNIGNFALPFVSYFFDSAAVLIVCLFDAGNSIMCLGIAYGLACCVRGQEGENIFHLLCRSVLSSVPVLSYIVMLLLAFFSITLPSSFIHWASIPASANTFLSMMMIGVALGISLKKDSLRVIYTDIGVRFMGAAGMAAGVYFFLDYPMEIKRVLIILLFSPIAGMACYYTAKLKGNIGVAACISSLYILVSIVMMSALIIFLSHTV